MGARLNCHNVPVDLKRDRPPAGLSRRRLLAAGSVTAALLTAGCNPFSTTQQTRTVIATAPPPIDPMDQLIAMVRLHLLRLEADVKIDEDTAKKLTTVRDDRRAHLQALLDEQARANRTSAAPLTQAGQAVPASADARSAIERARADAQEAQLAFADQITVVSRYRAAIFSSISACLITHRLVL